MCLTQSPLLCTPVTLRVTVETAGFPFEHRRPDRVSRAVPQPALEEYVNAQQRPLEILLLIVDPGRNAGTIRDHIDAFKRFSRHRISILNNNAAALRPMGIAADTFPAGAFLAGFDALVIHYTNYLADPTHFDARAPRSARL